MQHRIKFRLESKPGVKPYFRLCDGIIEAHSRRMLRCQMANLLKSVNPDVNVYFHEYDEQLDTEYCLQDVKLDNESLMSIEQTNMKDE